jgi:hypothetical protein
MTPLYRLAAIGVLLALGCAGATRVMAPDDARGYRPVALRDIAVLGLKDENVEVEASVLAVEQGPAEGLMAIQLTGMSPSVAALPETVSAMVDSRAVTLTLPVSRYGEVRGLKPLTRVRARGYLSNSPGWGYPVSNEGDRYLWVDHLEPLS